MRLVSFLGKGDREGKYHYAIYKFCDGQEIQTNYVAHALARFNNPHEILILATEEAWKLHGVGLSKALSSDGFPDPVHVVIPPGGEPEHLWIMFNTIVDSFQTSDGPVLLDITHGFRMQPFFAAACIQYVQAVMPSPPQIGVVYGEFRGEGQASPIWELTPFLDVLTWSRSLMMFLQTGQADAVVKPTNELARNLGMQWATSGTKAPKPRLQKLSKALQQFSDDLNTVRTGSLLLGERASSQKLADAIEQSRQEVNQYLPVLARVLDLVAAMIKPLQLRANPRLSAPDGQRALVALARLYQKMGRYSEAISILREGWMTLGAPQNADHPGTREFDNSAREELEKKWSRRSGHPDPISEIRNDIQHAGFKKQPHDKDWFKKQLDKLLLEWEAEISAEESKSENHE